MSIQDDGVTLYIDHDLHISTQFANEGRGSHFPSKIRSPLNPTHTAPGQSVITEQNIIAAGRDNQNMATKTSVNNAVEAIYASGDQAKIAAWENFVALKKRSNETLMGQEQVGDFNDSSSQIDHGAARITDKAMLVDTNVRTHQASPLGSPEPGSFTHEK